MPKDGVPYAIIKGKARLGTVVHKKTAAVLALTEVRSEDKTELSKLVQAIKEVFTPKRLLTPIVAKTPKTKARMATRGTLRGNRNPRLSGRSTTRGQSDRPVGGNQPRPSVEDNTEDTTYSRSAYKLDALILPEVKNRADQGLEPFQTMANLIRNSDIIQAQTVWTMLGRNNRRDLADRAERIVTKEHTDVNLEVFLNRFRDGPDEEEPKPHASTGNKGKGRATSPGEPRSERSDLPKEDNQRHSQQQAHSRRPLFGDRDPVSGQGGYISNEQRDPHTQPSYRNYPHSSVQSPSQGPAPKQTPGWGGNQHSDTMHQEHQEPEPLYAQQPEHLPRGYGHPSRNQVPRAPYGYEHQEQGTQDHRQPPPRREQRFGGNYAQGYGAPGYYQTTGKGNQDVYPAYPSSYPPSPPPPQTGPGYPPPNGTNFGFYPQPEHQGPNQYQPPRNRRLAPKDIGFFDGEPGTQTAIAFSKRLIYLAGRYGPESVLDPLPLCLKGRAETWFTGLEPDVANRVTSDLGAFCYRLQHRCKSNASSALSRADAMSHSFKDEFKLDVREYITQKHALYIEAGEYNQDLIVRRLHEGLDPTLRAVVTLYPEYNTMDDFCNRVYALESSARRQYNQVQSLIDHQNQQIAELRSQLNRQGGNPRRERIDYGLPITVRNNVPLKDIPIPNSNAVPMVRRILPAPATTATKSSVAAQPDKPVRATQDYPCTVLLKDGKPYNSWAHKDWYHKKYLTSKTGGPRLQNPPATQRVQAYLVQQDTGEYVLVPTDGQEEDRYESMSDEEDDEEMGKAQGDA